MTKKIRLIIVLVGMIGFFVIAPILVLYSEGYRFDFKTKKLMATGGIYIKTYPAADQITIDSKIIQKPGMFSNSIFVQSLLPTSHSVLVQKNGYYDYSKTISVQKNEVTKLENILLIKQSIPFQALTDKIDYFSIAPNKQDIITALYGSKSITLNYSSINSISRPYKVSMALSGKISNIEWSSDSGKALIKAASQNIIYYYLFDGSLVEKTNLDKNAQQISFNPQNSSQMFYLKNNTLYSLQKSQPSVILKNVASYGIYSGSILWISTQGVPQKSNISGTSTETLAKAILNPDYFDYASYKIKIIAGKIFFTKSNSLLLYDPASDSIKEIPTQIENYKLALSSDGKNLIYYNNKDVYLYSFSNDLTKNNVKIFSGDQMTTSQWLNNDYIMFVSGDKIIISEIDFHGNINAVTLEQATSPTIDFNQQDGKLYILTNNTLLSSEKITP